MEGKQISNSMSRRYSIILSLVLIYVVGLTSCSKKEEIVPPPPSTQQMQDQMPQQMPQQNPMMEGHADIQMPKSGEMKVIVPDNIKTRWKGVRLTITDKEANAAKDYTVGLNSRFSIPDSKIEVQTGDFLPDLKIEGNIYATETSDLLNPAVYVFVTENGKEVFKGWLFQKFPNVHPFKHQRFGITLKEAVAGL